MSLLHISPTPHSLSSLKVVSPCPISLPTLTTKLNLTFKVFMGGGPRTFPGGVSKWQWKRMQRNKSQQLLKTRLARERQIYEMRKRAELKAAVSELERPWERVEKPPNLFSVSADDQLKVLADRFQKPGGMDLWSEKDGPEVFRVDNGLPEARFVPKGVVYSGKPYGGIGELGSGYDENFVGDEGEDRRGESVRRGRRKSRNVSDDSSVSNVGEGKSNVKGNGRMNSSNLEKINRLISKGRYDGGDTGGELVKDECYGRSRIRGSSLELGGGNVSDVKLRSYGGSVSEGRSNMKGNGRMKLSNLEKINGLITKGSYEGEDTGDELIRNEYYGRSRIRGSSLELGGGNKTDVRLASYGGSVSEGKSVTRGNRRMYMRDSEKMSHLIGRGSYEEEGTSGEEMVVQRNRYYQNSRNGRSSLGLDGGNVSDAKSRSYGGNVSEGKTITRGNRRTYASGSERINEEMAVERSSYYGKPRSRSSLNDSDVSSRSSAGNVGGVDGNRSHSRDSGRMDLKNGSFGGYHGRNARGDHNAGGFRRSRGYQKGERRNSEVFDMSLQNDGTYG